MSTLIGERVAAPRPEKATLRHQLLISLLAPIVLVTLMSSVVSYYYAFNFATLAYDYSLSESARDISRQIRYDAGQLRVDLPRAALDMLESDKHDRIYYTVNDSKSAFVAGLGLREGGRAARYFSGMLTIALITQSSEALVRPRPMPKFTPKSLRSKSTAR